MNDVRWAIKTDDGFFLGTSYRPITERRTAKPKLFTSRASAAAAITSKARYGRLRLKRHGGIKVLTIVPVAVVYGPEEVERAVGINDHEPARYEDISPEAAAKYSE